MSFSVPRSLSAGGFEPCSLFRGPESWPRLDNLQGEHASTKCIALGRTCRNNKISVKEHPKLGDAANLPAEAKRHGAQLAWQLPLCLLIVAAAAAARCAEVNAPSVSRRVVPIVQRATTAAAALLPLLVDPPLLVGPQKKRREKQRAARRGTRVAGLPTVAAASGSKVNQ